MPHADDQRLHDRVRRQAARMRKAERERESLIAQTVYLGTLGLVFVLPVLIGVVVGTWLDGMHEGYSVKWTAAMLVVGLVVGAINVYLMIRE